MDNGGLHDGDGERAERAERARSFGAIAEDYDRFRPGPPVEAVRWLLPPDCGLVVDVGAGTGALTRLLVGRADRVVAVEPDDRMAAVLRDRVPGAEVQAGRAERLPVPDGAADAVLGSSMWHWVDEEAATAEGARVLRPGGVLGVLWSGPDRRRGWLAELLPAVPGGLSARIVDPADERPFRHELHLPPGAPFSEPERLVVEFSIDLSPEELVGLAATFSSVIRLPEPERAEVLDLVREVVGGHPALAGRDRVGVPMRCAAWRAVRSLGSATS